ncbi:MAG: hypothetical protein ACFB9M_09955 [Myxococcota bacterium]
MSERSASVDAIPFILSRRELRVLVRALARGRRGLTPYLREGREEWEVLVSLQQRSEEALRHALEADEDRTDSST